MGVRFWLATLISMPVQIKREIKTVRRIPPLELQFCEEIFRKGLIYYTGFQDENGFLFVMPEAKEIKKYDKTVYSKIMDYVLTKLILLYQSDDVTKSKNEVQFLIDRSAHDWPEIYTLLDGFAPYASHVTKIIFISPNRFKTYLSPFAVNSVWNDRFTYFYSFNHAQLKNPKLLASEHIPFVMGGSLTHNWTEYNEHELEIMIYNKSLATHNESFISHNEAANLDMIAPLTPTSQVTLSAVKAKYEKLEKAVKVEILNCVEERLVGWKVPEKGEIDTRSLTPQCANLITLQNSQMCYIAGKSQALIQKVRENLKKVEKKLSDASFDDNLLVELQKISEQGEAKASEISTLNLQQKFDLDNSPGILKRVMAEMKAKKDFEDKLLEIESNSKPTHLSKLQAAKTSILNFSNALTALQQKATNSLLMLFIELEQDESEINIENVDQIKSELQNFQKKCSDFNIDDPNLVKTLNMLESKINMAF